MIVNGKEYPLWGQFVEKQDEWIGGTLKETGYGETITTKITGIHLTPNGDDSAFFTVEGEDFDCGFDVQYGGIGGDDGDKDWLIFHGYGGHTWKMKKPEKKQFGNI